MSFYFRDEVLPYYAGDTAQARDLAANDFKYWELMRRACERGVRLFDYGRSKQGTGSYAFKKNWGFEPSPLAYEYALYGGGAVPQNNPLNPKYRAMIALWRRLPRPVVERGRTDDREEPRMNPRRRTIVRTGTWTAANTFGAGG